MSIFGRKRERASDLFDQGAQALASTVRCLKWVRDKRGKTAVSPGEYIAESRLVIALDELRKGLNAEKTEGMADLVREVTECYTELWNEVQKRIRS